MEIKAAVTYNVGDDLKIEDVQLREPNDDEVLVRIVASGVCHTDAEGIAGRGAPIPAVFGHEGSGIVEKIGQNVKNVVPGDHVVLSVAYCGECDHCLSGHQTVCDRAGELNFGGTLNDGTHRLYKDDTALSTFFGQSSFATYSVAHKNNIVKVDKDIDLALLGPLGCGIQTGAGTILNTLKPEFGTSVVIFGAGAVGLSSVMAAKISGCKDIIVSDIHDSRLQLAKELGATHVLNASEVDVVKAIKEITGKGAHYTVETTGVSPVVKQSINALRPLGTCAIVGMAGDISLNITNEILLGGIKVIGVLEGDSIPQIFIPQLVEYYKSGKFPFDKLVKFYDFNDINQAFEDSKSGVTIKPILKMK